MSKVFVLDQNKQPLDPVHPGYARKLLDWGKAVVYRQYPFTLILKETRTQPGTHRDENLVELKAQTEDKVVAGAGSQPLALALAQPQPLRLKLDPGSKTTGIAVVNDATGEVVWAAELQHRGQQVRDDMLKRRGIRRNRRARHTRYRPARFLNRRRREGWLPPSLESRLVNTLTWVRRLTRYCPIRAISQELVRFDTQLMQNPEVSGIEYQQGELAGYELREYLLEKYQRTCVYCGVTGVPMEIEHLVPKSRGGSNRVSNLALACHECNGRKGNQTAVEFGYPHVAAKARQPLRDTAAVNTTRWALYTRLQHTGLPVEVGSGGLTKYNRTKRGLPKTHWTDAACVGHSTPERLEIKVVKPLLIQATGHGKRQMCGTNKYGFPIRHRTSLKSYLGFKTGDLVQANIPVGKYKGKHTGRIAIRQRPCFQLKGFDVHPKYLHLIQRGDGYVYSF